ncbi:hypothetical protein yc1106_05077 [Curvularia clavata]|uniref:Transcription factor Iwr1 domain-containing protein n=1 Tax=Curvularia clavata TaxID=95742 RepID=A0A9Q8ZBL6_CURCL|nr:hypothetical protein yc1106_05077 [Curvularia clavata]
MSHMPPQTISIKRKRTEAPVDSLRINHEVKRQKSQNLDSGFTSEPEVQFFFRRLTKPGDDASAHLASAPPTPTAQRRFRLDPISRIGAKRHFVEEQEPGRDESALVGGQVQSPASEPEPDTTSRPRKRPGAGSALRHTSRPGAQRQPQVSEPSENDVRKLEALSKEVEKTDNLKIPPVSPSKYKPKAPAKRFAERHPEKVAALSPHDGHAMDGDAMDVDSEYVYDHYVREPVLPNAPEPTGTVGLLVIGEEDADWWDNEEASDREFDTDDEDENAEDYYANDYPEDEMSDDDEFDRNLYKSKYRHGSDDEEYDIDNDNGDEALGSGEDEDDLHFKMTVPKSQRVGYWGMQGE